MILFDKIHFICYNKSGPVRLLLLAYMAYFLPDGSQTARSNFYNFSANTANKNKGKGENLMKWMIASDIHGSEPYCRAMLEAYDREGVDRLLLLGDLLYHGPRNDLPNGYAPKAVIALLNARKNDILCVRGNCDAEVDQMVLDFPIMADYAVINEGTLTIFATHGHVYNEQKPPKMPSGTVLLHGHTHVPKCTVHEDYIYMNPGSVSIPKEGSRHGYMTLSDGIFVWRDFSGNELHRFEIGKE